MQKRLVRKGIVIGIIVLFVGASIITTGSLQKEHDNDLLNNFEDWWDDDWHFRKQLSIGDASEDYQMLIKVWKEDGYDDVNSGVIDCEGHCNDDFTDIRFVDNDQETLLSYWIEDQSLDRADHFAYIWVKTPGSGTIFMYYGNEDASSESDGDETFGFYDDFQGDDYNHDIWETEGSAHTWTVSNSIMTMQSTGDPGVPGAFFKLKPEAKITVPYGHIIYSKLSSNRDPNPWASMPYIFTLSSDPSPDTDYMNMYYREEGGDHMRTEYSFNGVLGGSDNDISSGSWIDNAWYYFIIQSDSNAPYASFQVLREDKSQWGNKVEATLEYYDDFSPFEFWYYQRPYSSGGNTKVDWVFVGKYDHSTQPSWNNFGVEEELILNQPPGQPLINGPVSGNPCIEYSYTFIAVDPDNDDLYYEIDWGDGDVEVWFGPFESNELVIKEQTWDEQGTFTIKARAKDVYDAIGEWGALEVEMPVNMDYSSVVSLDAGLVWIHRTSEVDYDGIYDVNSDGQVNFQDAGLTWVNRD